MVTKKDILYRTIFLVCGYGIWIHQDYRRYLDDMWEGISSEALKHPNDHYCLIFSGGKTSGKRYPGESEAHAMLSYLETEVSWLQSRVPNFQVLLEDESITTWQNILKTKQLMRKYEIAGWRNFVLCCDSSRRFKAIAFVKYIFGITPICWHYQVTRHRFKEWLQIRVITPLSIAAIYFPPLRWLEEHQRRKQIARS